MPTSNQELIIGSDTTLVTDENLELQDEILEVPMQDMFLNMEPLSHIANGNTVRIPKNPHFSRRDVVQSFQTAFELMGGVPRLAIWANSHETEFFKLYARLLPSQASSALGESNILKIEMSIPKGPLDV